MELIEQSIAIRSVLASKVCMSKIIYVTHAQALV